MDVRRLLPVFALLLALAACGSEEPGPGSGSGSPGGLPVGRAFDATGASEGGATRPLAAKASIEFQADGRVVVATGCNTAAGPARLRDGRLVTDDLSVTAMGCLDPAVSAQESFVLSVVDGDPELALDGDTLVLRTATAEIRFLDRKVADPDRPLEGTRWKVTGSFTAQMASTTAAPMGEVTITGGRLRYAGPCHDREGAATVKGSTVAVGALTMASARPCDAAREAAEDGIASLLTGNLRATVQAASLRLVREDGSGVTLVAAP